MRPIKEILEDAARDREIAEKATAGPYQVGRMEAIEGAGREGAAVLATERGDMVVGVADCGFDSPRPQDDAANIAHNADPIRVLQRAADVEALASEVERLRGIAMRLNDAAMNAVASSYPGDEIHRRVGVSELREMSAATVGRREIDSTAGSDDDF